MEDITMKKWNTPEVTELNISETANGIKWWYNEGTREPLTGYETKLGEEVVNQEEGKDGEAAS